LNLDVTLKEIMAHVKEDQDLAKLLGLTGHRTSRKIKEMFARYDGDGSGYR